MYRLTLSIRYLLSRRLNVICVIGISLGVALMITVLSVMDGFQDQLKATLRGSLSDLIITPRYRVDFERLESELMEREPEIRALSPQLQDFAIVSPVGEGRRRDEKVGAFVIGVDAARESAVSEFREYLKDRRSDEFTVIDPDRPFFSGDEDLSERFPGVVLGRDLADDLRVGPGNLVYLLTALQVDDEETGETELKPREKRFVVTGYYESGNGDYDGHVVYVDREAARDFTGARRDLAEVRVRLERFDRAEEVKARLSEIEYEIFRATAKDRALVARVEESVEVSRQLAQAKGEEFRVSGLFRPGRFLAVETWRDRRKVFLAAIENEKGIMALIVGFIIVVAAFMVVGLLSMLVVHKTRDIGIIKALGGTTRGVLSIFMWNGFIMGVAGAIVGTAGGLALVTWINEVESFVSKVVSWILGREVGLFPKKIYLFSEIPTSTDPQAVVLIALFAVLCAWLAALYPALRAARMRPVEALRYE